MSAESDRIPQDLSPREAIARAVRILMATHQVGEETALNMLVRVASESHLKIREAARRIVVQSRPS
jgi:AmiR/NasT family two-component response regulator